MTPEHRTTPEEEAYGNFLHETWEMLSEAAHTVIEEAQSAAYADNMVRSYCFQPEEYDEAMEKMRVAAAELSDRECERLAKFWRTALAAAASIDSEDFETLVGYRAYSGNLHRYYRMLSGMVEQTLQKKRFVDLQNEIAQREPEDISDIPF